MKKITQLLFYAMVLSILVSPVPVTASSPLEQKTITICTSHKSGYQFISTTGKCNQRIYETRTWYRKGTAPDGTPGSDFLELRTCISKSTKVQIIRMPAGCNSKIQTTALWQRPVGPPVAPSITSVAMGVLGTATLNISASSEDGGARVTSYIVTSMPGDITATFKPNQIKAARVSGLTPGNLYSFSVIAINSKGRSPASISPKPTLAPTIPKAPTITRVVATGTNTAQITFTAPTNDGGAPITSYTARSHPGGLQTTVYQSTSGTIDISNLIHSTRYTFTLIANNDAGASPESDNSTSITTATPPVPVAAAPSPSPTPSPTPTLSTISVAAIAGVTVPVTGATPVTATTAGTGYTGAVTWASSGGALGGNFAATTTYTATITLTAAAGYTLTGVTANFFSVAGATSVTHFANSGVITAVFPATAKLSQSITFATPSAMTVGGSTQTVAPTASSSLTVTLTSTTTGICTVAGFVITPVAPGTCSITASQTGNANYEAAPDVTKTFASRATQSITFTIFPSDISFGTSPAGLGAISTSGLTVAFTTATSGVCTVSGTTVTVVSVGTCTINANQDGNVNFEPASQVAQSFTIARASPSLSNFANVSKNVGDASFSLTAPTVANSLPGSFAYTSATTATATISGSTITLGSAGTTLITATFTPTDAVKYNNATITMTLTLSVAAPAFTLSSSSETRTVNTAATGFSINSTGGAIASFAISATPAGMSFNTSTGALTGTPTTVASAIAYTVTATNATGSTTQTFTLTVSRAAQATLSITSLTTNTKAFPYSQALSIATSGGSGTGDITFAIASGGTASECALSNSTATATITATTNGTCRIQATKAADSINNETTSAAATFIFDKASQSITFGTPSAMTVGGSNQTVAPTASSSLTVTLTSTTTGICTVAGFVITAVGSGTCSITASQAGNANYLPAFDVVRTFGVLKGIQSITFTTPSAMTVGGSNQTVAPTASSSLTVTLTSTTTGICTVAGFVITAASAGTCSITANQAGNTNYEAAANVTRTFAVSGPATAAALAITTEPQGAPSGSVLGTQPVIRIIDAGGNTVTTSTANVVVSISSGTGTLSGTTTVAAVSGVATFTNLVITGTAGAYTLTFGADGLTGVTATLFLTEGPAAKVVINRDSAGTQRRTAFTTQPQITIQDAANNRVTQSEVVVTATVSAGGTLVGTTTATASAGIATFNGLGVDGNVGTTYTITYTAEGLTVATATVTLTGTTCDGISFTCKVGDIGPGGGTVFYVASGTFTQVGATGSMCATNCKYLEAAPTTSATFAWTDNVYVWSGNTAAGIGATAQQTAIGTGYANTLAIVGQSNTPNMAATISQAYRGPNGLSDWFLPSKDELNQIYAQKTIVGGIASWYYWSSSEGSFATTRAWAQSLSNGAQGEFFKSRSDYYVRPIRAFGLPPTTISAPAIAGVTAPVTGATPVTTTTAGTGYTGSVSWSGSPATFVANTRYTATITLTATSGYTLTGVSANFFTVTGASSVTHSANSGVITAVFYMVNSIGPGGGEIFYVAPTPFDCGPTNNRKKCTYLEAAPGTWFDGNQDPTLVWAGQTPPNLRTDSVTTGSAIGSGYQNSLNIVNQGNGATTAAGAARAYSVTVGGVVFNDWFLPSLDELYELYLVRNTFVDLVNGIYWSSTEFNSTFGFAQFFYDASQRSQTKGSGRYVRPVRSF